MATTTDDSLQTLNIVKEIQIAAPVEISFAALLEELGPGGATPDGRPFPMKLEAWPGGRWFRDLGNNAGHLWGHVQVIKPPGLLEIRGPMFMSYPAVNFLQYRLSADGGGTLLKVTHQAFGQIPARDREGVHEGWQNTLNSVQAIAERMVAQRK